MSAVLQERQEQVETPTTQTIVLPVSEQLMAGIRSAGAVVEAQAWEITDAQMAQLAAVQRTTWAKRIDAIKSMRKDFVEPAQLILERAKKWFLPPIEDLEAGREILGAKLLTWDQQEKARLAREQAERAAAARRLRQEAEAKAAAERARAEEQAREARRKEQEAQEAQRKALAEGNARAAAAAAAEAAKQAEKAQAAVENGEAKAQAAQLEAAAHVAAAPVAEPVKIVGQSVKDNWVRELVPGLTEEDAKAMIAAAATRGAELRPELLGLLKLDTSAIDKMAKALKGSMRVPGFVAVNRPQIAGSRK